MEVLDPLWDLARTRYDAVGNVVSTVDPLGNETQYVYDGRNQKIKTIDARGGVTTEIYDAASNRTSLIDPVGNRTTFAYDSLNRLSQETDPLSKSVTFAYNATGQMASRTDRLGRRRDFSYDNVGRETGETWVNAGGGTAQLLTFSYDAVGSLLTAAGANGTYTMAYDAINQVTGVQEPFSQRLTFSYDAVGNRTQVDDSKGGITTSTYDAANRLTNRKFGGSGQTPLRIDFTYTTRDQGATATRYSDLAGTTLVGSATYTYDGAQRVTNIQQRNSGGNLIANYTYTYDLASRLTSEIANGTTTSYAYDATSQLTNDGTTTFTYDLNGNRTMTGYSTGTGNRLTNDGTWTYTYDDEGNLTKKSKEANAETWTYGYDHRNQMTWAEKRATDGGTLQMRADYKYDAFGNRIEKAVDPDGAGQQGTTTTLFVLDGWKVEQDSQGNRADFIGNENWDVWADLDGSNNLQTRYLRGDFIDSLFARVSAGGTAAWYLQDRLRSVRDLTDNSGVLQNHINYDGFGKTLLETNPGFVGHFEWTGRELDGETSFQFSRARYFNLATGIWTNEDPLKFASGDVNLFRYAANTPTNYTDPSGLGWYGPPIRILPPPTSPPPPEPTVQLGTPVPYTNTPSPAINPGLIFQPPPSGPPPWNWGQIIPGPCPRPCPLPEIPPPLTPEGCPDPYNFDPFGPQPPVIIPIQRILDIFEISPTINWPPTWGGPAFIPPRQGGSPGVGYWFDLPWPPWETPYYPPLPGTRP